MRLWREIRPWCFLVMDLISVSIGRAAGKGAQIALKTRTDDVAKHLYWTLDNAGIGYLIKLRVYDFRIFMPIINMNPHLQRLVSRNGYSLMTRLTFRKVLKPARMLPPIHVLYFLSGGAKIFIRISLTASRCTSCNNLSPNPFVRVPPPESTMLPKSDFRRSMSVRLMASTTI